MGKVKLTQVQADVIEQKKKYDGRGIQAILRDIFYEPNETTSISGVNEIVREIGMEDFLKALYIGYEVEREFKVGDWVKHLYKDDVGVFTELGRSYIKYDDGYSDSINNFRHASPEEVAKEKRRRWWASHGRDVRELKGHDVLTHSFFGGNHVVFSVYNDTIIFYAPNEDRMLEDVRKNFKVKYFAEDRKDLGDD